MRYGAVLSATEASWPVHFWRAPSRPPEARRNGSLPCLLLLDFPSWRSESLSSSSGSLLRFLFTEVILPTITQATASNIFHRSTQSELSPTSSASTVRCFRPRHEAVAETHTDRSVAIQRFGFPGFIPGPVIVRLTDRYGRALVIRSEYSCL